MNIVTFLKSKKKKKNEENVFEFLRCKIIQTKFRFNQDWNWFWSESADNLQDFLNLGD